VKLAAVYYHEQNNLNTNEILQMMKEQFEKEDWEFSELFVDNIDEYERLMEIITEELKSLDVLFVYSKINICDDFYRDLLYQSAQVENVTIKEYIKFNM
jgi:hypothetical protein